MENMYIIIGIIIGFSFIFNFAVIREILFNNQDWYLHKKILFSFLFFIPIWGIFFVIKELYF